ncbi:MAG: tetratricopeptide repeat protein [Bacteroidales bacterium]|jgi:tetratricopeptide (TPR) repeat protein|nr:tetratricopeptide repeat protein [Bacteroidales bacterium]
MKLKVIVVIVITFLSFTSCSGQRNIGKSKTKVKKELSADSEQQYYYLFLEANRKKVLGDLNGALALYYQCLELNPDAAAAMAEISKLNEIMQNFEVAIKYAEQAIKIDSGNKWYKVNLAKLYLVIKDYNNAIKTYEQLYLINKTDLEIPYNLAALYNHVGNYKRAIELYNDIEKNSGVNENLSIAKQQLYGSIGNKTKAYNEIDNLILHYPNEPKFYGIRAEMYTNDNLFIKAKENYNKLFALDSTNALGMLSIIDFYRKKMDYDNAFKIIKKVIYHEGIEVNQKILIFVSFLNIQSEFNIYNQQIKEHLLLLKEAYPDVQDVYTVHADFLIKSNLFDEAQTEIEYILDNFTGNIVIWEQLLSIYSYKSNFDQLYVKSIIAIDSFPQHALFYFFNGVSATQINKPGEAITILNKGLEWVKNSPDLEVDFYTNLAEAYYSKKEYMQSDYFFEMVLKKEPDNLYVINNYSYYLSLREEKLEYAETLSKKSIIAEPNNSTYLDTYAWILFKLERYQDALLYIKTAFEHGGAESDVIVEHYGDILFMIGNKEAAVELWKLSNEMGNTNEKLIKKIETKSIF